MNLSNYFTPVEFDYLGIHPSESNKQLLINKICFFDGENETELYNKKIAIIGVKETRNSVYKISSMAPDEIRRELYNLYCWKKDTKIIDLGNFILGKTVEDTYFGLAEIVAHLIDAKIIPIIIGGSNDLLYATYKAYENLNKIVSIVSIDSTFDIETQIEEFNSNSYLSRIITQQPNVLFNYSNIGYQTYLNTPSSIALMEKLLFETYRVGIVRNNIADIEPVIRSADSCFIDISAIRQSDAPGNPKTSANGFYGEEICEIAYFTGMNDNLTSFCIYEYDPALDYRNQTAQLISHIIWYFIEGYTNRQNDLSFKVINNYIKHIVTISDIDSELIFYNSKKTNRWWIEVPIYDKSSNKKQFYFLPCSITDFETACKNSVPERWWKAFKKLNK